MITRIFRVRVPAMLHVEFEERFLSVSVPFVIVSCLVSRAVKRKE